MERTINEPNGSTERPVREFRPSTAWHSPSEWCWRAVDTGWWCPDLARKVIAAAQASVAADAEEERLATVLGRTADDVMAAAEVADEADEAFQVAMAAWERAEEEALHPLKRASELLNRLRRAERLAGQLDRIEDLGPTAQEVRASVPQLAAAYEAALQAAVAINTALARARRRPRRFA